MHVYVCAWVYYRCIWTFSMYLQSFVFVCVSLCVCLGVAQHRLVSVDGYRCMHIHVYVCVCTQHKSICRRIWSHMYVCVCTQHIIICDGHHCMQSHVCVCIYIYIHMWVRVRVHVCMWFNSGSYVTDSIIECLRYVCMHIYIYIYSHLLACTTLHLNAQLTTNLDLIDVLISVSKHLHNICVCHDTLRNMCVPWHFTDHTVIHVSEMCVCHDTLRIIQWFMSVKCVCAMTLYGSYIEMCMSWHIMGHTVKCVCAMIRDGGTVWVCEREGHTRSRSCSRKFYSSNLKPLPYLAAFINYVTPANFIPAFRNRCHVWQRSQTMSLWLWPLDSHPHP